MPNIAIYCYPVIYKTDDKKENITDNIIEIEKKLEAQNVNVNWTIIGKGVCKEELVNQWIDKQNCNFFEPVNTIEVFNILHNQDIFVFPTNFEGTPVSILESIACGVVPIVNDLPGGIRDIVLAEIGFRCTLNNLDEFVNTINAGIKYGKNLID